MPAEPDLPLEPPSSSLPGSVDLNRDSEVHQYPCHTRTYLLKNHRNQREFLHMLPQPFAPHL